MRRARVAQHPHLELGPRLAAHVCHFKQILPKVVDTAGICSYTKQLDAIPAGIPVAAVGDRQAALFGQACFDRGMRSVPMAQAPFYC